MRIRFLATFLGLLVVFEVLLLVDVVDRRVIRPFTSGVAVVAGLTLRALGEPVQFQGSLITSTCFAVDIKNGCNGVEAMLFIGAAILAFPAPWRSRLAATLLGLLIVQVANWIRVVTLYLLGCHQRAWFDAFHLAVWQSIIFAVCIAYFLLWTRRVKPAHAA